MKLTLKKSNSHWVKGTEGEEFFIDYPTREQEQFLQGIVFGDEYSGMDKALKFAQYFLKFTIKDWKGIKDEDSKEIKCLVKDNELDTDLWWALVRDTKQAFDLYFIFEKELEFTINDKKKLSSQQSSNKEGISQETEKNTQ